MIEVEIRQDDTYYWLVFTIFFSVVAVVGAALFVISYKIMLCLRRKRLGEKALQQKNRV